MLWIPHLWPNRFLQAQICLPTRILDNTIYYITNTISHQPIVGTHLFTHTNSKITIYQQFLMFNVHFAQKQLKLWYEILYFSSVFHVRGPFRAKGFKFTSYYEARTKYVPVLLRTTKLAQSTSQYHFVLQSSHKVRPSTTSYYKAYKVRPSTTSYYKACTKYVKNRNFTSALDVEPHFVRKGCAGPLKIAILPQFLTFDVRFVWNQFLTFDVHFARKGWNWHLKIAILPQFLTFDVHFARKGWNWHLKIAILPQFLTFDVHFVRKGWNWHLKIAILPQFWPLDVHFVRFVAFRQHRPRLKRERKKSERETYSEKEKRSADM